MFWNNKNKNSKNKIKEVGQKTIQTSLTQQEKIEYIERANDAHVLMKHLVKLLGLGTKCTHTQFVEAFSKLQSDAGMYTKELQESYLSAKAATKAMEGIDQIREKEEQRQNDVLNGVEHRL